MSVRDPGGVAVGFADEGRTAEELGESVGGRIGGEGGEGGLEAFEVSSVVRQGVLKDGDRVEVGNLGGIDVVVLDVEVGGGREGSVNRLGVAEGREERKEGADENGGLHLGGCVVRRRSIGGCCLWMLVVVICGCWWL